MTSFKCTLSISCYDKGIFQLIVLMKFVKYTIIFDVLLLQVIWDGL